MKKLYSILILSSLSNNAFCHQSEDFFKEMRELDREWDELVERRMQKMSKMRESFFDSFFKRESTIKEVNFPQMNEIQIKDSTDSIEVIIPVWDVSTKHSDIELKAKGKNLEGSFSYNDHKVNFTVKNGIWFTTWMTYQKENKEEKDKEQFYQMSSSSASITQRLPKEVSNLEEASATYTKEEFKTKDSSSKEIYKLKIVLPKAEKKSDWKRIEVKQEQKNKEK